MLRSFSWSVITTITRLINNADKVLITVFILATGYYTFKTYCVLQKWLDMLLQ